MFSDDSSSKFCNFNEGMDAGNLKAVLSKFDAWVDAAAEQAGERGSYWYVHHDPLFDTATAGGTAESYDYAIGNYWQSMEDKEAGYAGCLLYTSDAADE